MIISSISSCLLLTPFSPVKKMEKVDKKRF